MKVYTFLFTLLFAGLRLAAQNKTAISLTEVQHMARENYPALKQKELYAKVADNKAKELNTNFLPQVSVVGQATYQSEVTELAIPLPGAIPFKQKADQYAFGLELKENLFDYGLIKQQKQVERMSGDIQSQQADAELIKLKERINQIYGNLLLLQENKKILLLRVKELDSKMARMRSAVENGAALKSNFLVLESEALSTQQKLEEIDHGLVAGFKILSVYTNKTIDTSATLSAGQQKQAVEQTPLVRPEIKAFDLQTMSLKVKEKMIFSNNLPKLFVFGRGYYGRPGFNFLNNDFRPYGLVGAGLNWNLSAYYVSSKEKANIRLNSEVIGTQRKLFEMNLQSTIIQQLEEIQRLEKLMATDKKIVDAKTQIRQASSSQLDNGVITSSDFIVDLNAENQAQFNMKLHEIQLLLAKENYNTTIGY